MQALVLTRAVPQPGRGADHRAYRLLEVVRQAGFDVDLLTNVGPGQDGSEVQSLHGLVSRAHMHPGQAGQSIRGAKAWMRGQPFTVAQHWQPEMAQQAQELAGQADLVVCVDAVHHRMVCADPGAQAPAVLLARLG